MQVKYYCIWSQNNHLPTGWNIYTQSMLSVGDRDQWWKCWYRSMSLSSNDSIDEYPHFNSTLKCCNDVTKCIDCFLAAHRLAGWLGFGICCTSIYFDLNGVLPFLFHFTYPSSIICTVCNLALIFDILCISKTIPHWNSAHLGNWFEPFQNCHTIIA